MSAPSGVSRYSQSAATRFNAALPADPASRAACITFVPPNAKLISASEKSLNAAISGPPAKTTARRAWSSLRTPSGDASNACNTEVAAPFRTDASALAAPSTTAPALRANPSDPSADFANSASTCAPKPASGFALDRSARANRFLRVAISTLCRVPVTQQPRPGKLCFRSGTTAPSGPATKRMRRSR